MKMRGIACCLDIRKISFHIYVEGPEVVVAINNKNLKWFFSFKSPSGKLARWALQVQSFNLKIVYESGKSHVVADMFSVPVGSYQSVFCELCNFVRIHMPTISPKDIREAQLQDDNLKNIMDCFEDEQKSENFANWTEKGFLINQGVLYRYYLESDAEEAQLNNPV